MRLNLPTFILIIYFLIIIISEFVYPGARKLVYTLPVLGLVSILKYRKLYFDRVLSTIVFLIGINTFAFLIYFMHQNQNSYAFIISLKEYIFICSPVIMMYIFYRYVNTVEFDKVLKIFTITFVILYLITNFAYVLSLFGGLSNFLLTSLSELESTYGLVYGIFPLYYFINKNRVMLLISLPLVFIGSKRVAILAVLISLFVYKIASTFRIKKKYFKFIAVIVNIFVYVIILNYLNGNIASLINNFSDININVLFNNRFYVWKVVVDNLNIHPITGNGIGVISSFLRSGSMINDSHYTLLHSDLIKIYLEFGYLMGSLFIYYLYSFVDVNIKILPILVYFNVLFLTDNSLIYVHVTIMIFLIISRLLKEEKNE
tara:strand:- start:6357 stop:7475 length:1119 start_codon:yes stop_codon:yes gene_type:complete